MKCATIDAKEEKESNYGYIFLLCQVSTVIQYRGLYLPDVCFKGILDALSAYLLWKKPPKSAVLIKDALKGVCRSNGCDGTNRLHNSIADAIAPSAETTA